MTNTAAQESQLPDMVPLPTRAVAKKPPNVHLAYVDGMRALAALYVVAHHALFAVCPAANPNNAIIGLFLYGHFAVSVFIVLSGFSLMIPVARGDGRLAGGAVRFYIARTRRILPPYFLALGLSLLLVYFFIGHPTGAQWDVTLPVTPKDVLYHLLLVQDVYDSSKINHVFWSISVEWHIYIFFPLLVLLHRIGGMLALGLVIIACFVIFLTVGQTSVGVAYLLNVGYKGIALTYFALFVLGMCGAIVAFSSARHWQQVRHHVPWLAIASLLALIIWRVNAVMPTPGDVANYSFAATACLDAGVGLFSICLLIVGARQETNVVKTFFGWRPLAFIGTFAYSIYLIHAPLIQLMWLYIVHPLHWRDWATFSVLLLVGMPIIVAISYGFYRVCEHPFVSTKPRTPPDIARFRQMPLASRCGLGGVTAMVVGASIVAIMHPVSVLSVMIDACGFFCSGAVIVAARYPIPRFGKVAPLYMLLFGVLLASYSNLIGGAIIFNYLDAPTLSWFAATIVVLGSLTLITTWSQALPKRLLQVSGSILLISGSILILMSQLRLPTFF